MTLTTTLATVFYLDEERVWFALRPKTFIDSLKKRKRKKKGSLRVCFDGILCLHTEGEVQGNNQNIYFF